MTTIFAIRDNVAESIFGGLHLFKLDAQAVRMFGDIAADTNTLIARRPADYDLLKLGEVREDSGEIDGFVGGPVVVITGAAWKAAQEVTP